MGPYHEFFSDYLGIFEKNIGKDAYLLFMNVSNDINSACATTVLSFAEVP